MEVDPAPKEYNPIPYIKVQREAEGCPTRETASNWASIIW